MREILFRGKTAKGEWVYGAYYKQEHFYGDEEEVHCIITTKDVLSNDLGLDYEEVIPETVGQFTGLTDKNGKKIFEGDIVKNYYRTGKVVFNEKTCGFEFWCNICVGSYGEKATHKCNFFGLGTVEVIGNIHDNHELLEK